MVESIYKAFEDFVVEFSGRRLAGALLLAVMGLGGFVLIDRYSPYFIMGRLERATGLLERVSSIDNGGRLNGKDDLQALRSEIVDQARRLVEPDSILGTFTVGQSALRKLGSGVAPWFLFTLAFLPSIRKDPSNWYGVFGTLILGITFGFLALFIPNTWATWSFLIVYSLGHFLLVVMFVLAWQARNKARLKRPPA